MGLIQELEAEAIAAFNETKSIPVFRPGDTVRIGVRVVEGERTRVQNYEGVCIARSNRGINSNFTVRKMSFGEGVERVFPLYSPNIDSIEVVRRGVVRRAKLYYLRGRVGKAARVRERRYVGPEEVVEAGLLHEQGATDAEGHTADEPEMVEEAAVEADAPAAEPSSEETA